MEKIRDSGKVGRQKAGPIHTGEQVLERPFTIGTPDTRVLVTFYVPIREKVKFRHVPRPAEAGLIEMIADTKSTSAGVSSSIDRQTAPAHPGAISFCAKHAMYDRVALYSRPAPSNGCGSWKLTATYACIRHRNFVCNAKSYETFPSSWTSRDYEARRPRGRRAGPPLTTGHQPSTCRRKPARRLHLARGRRSAASSGKVWWSPAARCRSLPLVDSTALLS